MSDPGKYRFTARHRLTRRTASGKRRLTISGLVVAGIVALAGVAVAIIMYTLSITGNVSSVSFLPQWTTPPAPSVVSTDGMTASPTFVNSTTLNVDLTNAHVGGTATIEAHARMQPGASEAGKIVGLVGTVPNGWTAELVSGSCGKTLPMAGTETPVRMKFVKNDGAVPTGELEGVNLEIQPMSSAPASPVCEVLE